MIYHDFFFHWDVMKITFITPFAGLAGGIRVVAMYAQGLQQRGHKITIASVPLRTPSLKEKIKRFLMGRGWPKKRILPSHFDGLDLDHTVVEKYRPIVNRDVPNADIVIATFWETAEWVNDFLPSKGKKYYFIQGHELFEWSPVERVKATYKLPFKKIVVSKWLSNIMQIEYGDDNVALIPNGVDTHFFTPLQRSKQVHPTIGFIYSTAAIKGCDIIIDALNTVLQTKKNLRILSFGAEPVSADLPLPQNTEFHYKPSQEKIREIYRCCDFWLFGSRAEGFGLPILEAMACGTPVIANAAGAAPELIAQGGGILLNEKSPESMTAGILNCLGERLGKWEKMSCSARETAKTFSWDHSLIMFENELLEGLKK